MKEGGSRTVIDPAFFLSRSFSVSSVPLWFKSRSRLDTAEHLLAANETLAAALVDAQLLEQTPTQFALNLLDGVGGRAVQVDRPAGAAIVTAGATELADDMAEH